MFRKVQKLVPELTEDQIFENFKLGVRYMNDGRRIMHTQGYIDKKNGNKMIEKMKTYMQMSEKYDKARKAEIEKVELIMMEDIETLIAENHEQDDSSRSQGWENKYFAKYNKDDRIVIELQVKDITGTV